MDDDLIVPERIAPRRTMLGIGAALAVGAVVGGEATAAPPARAATAPARPAARTGRQHASASAAAAAAAGARSGLFPHDPGAHLLRRATFGPRPRDVAQLKKLGIDRWLARQLDPRTIPDSEGAKAWSAWPLAGARPATVRKKVKQFAWDAVQQTAEASLARQVFSDRQLYEVVVDVFANHLHVPLPGEQWHTAPAYIRDVIRAHAFGRFEDMLLAAMRHPAMLNYLSNTESRKSDVNENLGRELLELHTVGVGGGYREQDVRSSARILSGRTWDWQTGAYRFDPTQHATGRVRVLGFTHANSTGAGGEAVGDAYLRYLARHPATAHQIARKLAVRFVADDPSPDLVNRLAAVYLRSGTSIRAVVAAVFRSSDFWSSVGTRMRRPLEDAVGTLRVLDVRRAKGMRTPISWLSWNLVAAGHAPLGWGPPNGAPDVTAAWLGAGAMIQRWNLHRTFVYGWWQHLGYRKAHLLVRRTAGMTTLQWTKQVSRRLLGVTPSGTHLAAVIAGAGLTPHAPAPPDEWHCGKIAALLLDSPYFQLR